jgi:hypothetical protein
VRCPRRTIIGWPYLRPYVLGCALGVSLSDEKKASSIVPSDRTRFCLVSCFLHSGFSAFLVSLSAHSCIVRGSWGLVGPRAPQSDYIYNVQVLTVDCWVLFIFVASHVGLPSLTLCFESGIHFLVRRFKTCADIVSVMRTVKARCFVAEFLRSLAG